MGERRGKWRTQRSTGQHKKTIHERIKTYSDELHAHLQAFFLGTGGSSVLASGCCAIEITARVEATTRDTLSSREGDTNGKKGKNGELC